MSHAQPAISLQEKPAAPPDQKPHSPTGFVLQSWEKGLLLVLLLGILYLRLWRRKRARTVVCSHCGKPNPPHRSNCQKCAAPLLKLNL